MKVMYSRTSLPIFYGWVILAVAFTTLFLVVGSRFSLGIFYVAILEDFGWSRASTAGAFSLMLVLHAIFSMVVGVLFDRIGPRLLFPIGALFIVIGFAACSQMTAIWQLYLFLGVIAGLGITALGVAPHMALVSTWFDRKRGLATGLTYAGTGAGQLVLALVVQGLIEGFDWRTAFLWLAALIAIVIIPLTAILHRRSPEEMGLAKDGDAVPMQATAEKPLVEDEGSAPGAAGSLLVILKKPAFWFMTMSVLGMSLMINLLLFHQTAHLTDLGYGMFLGATLLGVVGGLRSIGSMAFGALSDRIGRETAYTIASVFCFVGVVLLMSLDGSESAIWRLYGFVLLYGIGHGALGALYGAATADIFKGASLGTIFGLLEAAFGVGGAIGAFVAGYVFDVFGQYDLSFLLVLLAIIVSCLAMWLAAPRRYRSSQ